MWALFQSLSGSLVRYGTGVNHYQMWLNIVIKFVNNKKRSHTQLDPKKQVIAFQDRVITINIKEAQHPLK